MIKKRLISQKISDFPIIPGGLDVKSLCNIIQKDDPVILEIGANCGQTTIDFIKYFPKSTIHCFEPDPRAIKKFKKIINSPNVYLHEIAIGNINGYVTFHQSAGGESIEPEGWDQSGSIRAPKAHLEMFPWVRFDNKIDVQIMRLDDWAAVNNINDVDFIWADVQGAEVDMIYGALETLKKTRFIYSEYYNNECYDGQITLDQMYELLNQFLILARFDNDVLLENIFANKKLPSELLYKFLMNAKSSENFLEYIDIYGANSKYLI